MADAAGTQQDHHIASAGALKDAGGLPSDTNGGSTWEIEELQPEERPRQGSPSSGAQGAASSGDATVDDVYVAVGKGRSSMAALSWALRRLTKPQSFVYLVHVFPVVTSIPTPLGMMPKSQASPEQIETYLNQERSIRRQMLQKFLDQCRKFQVNVDVYLIESDQIANAIIKLVPVLHIEQLVFGVSKSNVRKLKRGSTIAGQVQKSAPLYCKVNIICDGKEVTTATTADPTPPLSPSPVNNSSTSNNPTPPSSTPNHDKAATNYDKKDSEPSPRERKKITKFFRCFSL
ncbi:U-box domain-containing protein 35-like [Phragmites australis]|uniref:U-box domain-containing protein 35-like n=1 Tax=Phragmites australis TaxID=29695 RepID=UPI002D7989E2|nr:U-box domain-containing protein 35-like [Phragmites australis]